MVTSIKNVLCISFTQNRPIWYDKVQHMYEGGCKGHELQM